MLSLVKLYQHDMSHQRTAVTQGPKGRPKLGCSGSACYRHKNLDWAVHRATPAVIRSRGENSLTRKVASGVLLAKGTHPVGAMQPQHFLVGTSPRWGPGIAPSRHVRKVVPLPDHANIQVSRGTKVAVGVAATAGLAYGAHKVWQHHQAKQHFEQSVNHHMGVGRRLVK